MSTYTASLRNSELIRVRARANQRRLYLACKWVVDTVLAAVLLVLVTPLLGILWILIRMDSPGSAIYIQERIGAKPRFKDGELVWMMQPFRFYKLRSMFHGVDEGPHREYLRNVVQGRCREGEKFKLTNDPRLTRLGHVLRRTSLDELPQLLNVLKGDMSLVGPRPVPPYEVELYQNPHYQRFAAIPGITGLWQVTARGCGGLEGMVRLDIEYIQKAGLWLDFKLLLRTIPAILSRRGAE